MTATQTRPAGPRAQARPAGRPTPAEAAWIRDHAWTPRMRNTFLIAVGFYSTCLCQSGRSLNCGRDRHDLCTGTLSGFHAIVGRPDGTIAQFPAPYRHPTDSATGPQYEHAALVWLADRVCRWVCPCDCHTAPPEPAQPAGPPEAVQLDIFGAAQ